MGLTIEDLRGLAEKLDSQEPLPIAHKLLIVHMKHKRMIKRFKQRYSAKRSWQRGAR